LRTEWRHSPIIFNLREIRCRLLTVKAVVLTLHYSAALLQAIVQAGALGYVLKSDADRNLVATVDAVSQGKPHFTKFAENPSDHSATEPLPHLAARPLTPAVVACQLSSREREAVRSLAQTMHKL
jgi:DNA-binding NarL/FixJ family response regulator